VDETFVDPIQFKLFLKTINACIELKTDLTFFNGVNFFLHVPNKHLVDSVITTKKEPTTLTEQFSKKSKIES
jgi:hypothetical protein